MRYIILLIASIAIVLCCSCGSGSSTPTTTQQEQVTASITITPSSATVLAGGVQQFAATAVGIANATVLWSIQEGAAGGTIDANGKYTAPMASGTYHVTAQSQGNPSISASVTVTVTSTGEAQGVYSGYTSTGNSFVNIILPNDDLVALYGLQSGNIFYVAGIIFGRGKSNHGTYTSDWIDDYYYTGTITNGSLIANYVVGSSFNGTLTETGTPTITFTGATMPSLMFNYNTPALLSDIVGTWSGTLLNGTPATITVNANGTFTGSSSGCAFNGTLIPNAQKNYFSANLAFGSSPCSAAGTEAAGIGVDYLVAGTTTRQLLIGARTTTYYSGPAQVFIGSR